MDERRDPWWVNALSKLIVAGVVLVAVAFFAILIFDNGTGPCLSLGGC